MMIDRLPAPSVVTSAYGLDPLPYWPYRQLHSACNVAVADVDLLLGVGCYTFVREMHCIVALLVQLSRFMTVISAHHACCMRCLA
jgi:hypothetical protein